MPVSIHHAILYTAVFAFIVALLTPTIYIITSNMLADAYRYESILEKANERVRVGGVVYREFHYAVRNLGLARVEISEIGYVDASGNKYVLETSTTVDPGVVYKSSRRSWLSTPLAVYVVTRRGNVFSGPVITINPSAGYGQLSIRSLLPIIHHIQSPITYIIPGSFYTLSITMNSYVFGFVLVKDINSDSSVLLEFGPYNVATFFKVCSSLPNCQPTFTESKSGSSGSISVSARYIFTVDHVGGNPYFKMTMPFTAQNSVAGMFVRGCVGMVWRSVSNTFFTFAKQQDLPGWGQTSSNYYYSDDFNILLFPSSVNIDNVKAILSNLGDRTWASHQYAEPPSGGVVEVYLTRCFTISNRNLQQVSFSPDSSPNYQPPGGNRIWTELVFPGTNNFALGSVNINEITLLVYVDTDIVLETITR